MAIVIKIKDLINLKDSLNKFLKEYDQELLDFNSKYRLSRLIKKINYEENEFNNIKHKLLKYYGEPTYLKDNRVNIKGESLLIPTGNWSIFNTDNQIKFEKKLNNILNKYIELDTKFRISMTDLKLVSNLSINDIVNLYPIINDDMNFINDNITHFSSSFNN